MQNAVSYLGLGTEHPYTKMNREAFLFTMINYFDTLLPDNAVGVDGYTKEPMTLAQKRRLRNEIIREAKKLSNNYNASHQRKVSIDDYQVLIHAFFKTHFGSEYLSRENEWCGYKTDNHSRSTIANKVSCEQAKLFIANIEAWDTKDAGIISPYDPAFFSSDAFTDETDYLGYVYYEGGPSDDQMIEKIHIAFPPDRYRIVGANARAVVLKNSKCMHMDAEGPLVKCGYMDIMHFIKTKKDKEDIKNFLLDNVDRITPVEREFMGMACKYMSEIGMEFTLSVRRDSEITLSTATGAEVRLFDAKDGVQYCGRMYMNGHPAYIGISNSYMSRNGAAPLDPGSVITNEDRMNALKWYFGGEQVPVSERRPDGSDVVSGRKVDPSLMVGQYKQLDHVKGLVYYGKNGEQPLFSTVTRSTTRDRNGGSGNNSVMLAYANSGGDRPTAVNLYIAPYSSSKYKSAEIQFKDSIPVFSASGMTVPEGDGVSFDLAAQPDQRWINYKNNMDISQAIPSDVVTMPDEVDVDGNPLKRVKDSVPASHVSYYQHLPVRNMLDDWVTSAKENHRRLLDLDSLLDDYQAYLVDDTVQPLSSADESIGELRTLYWKILTGKISMSDVKTYVDDTEMSGAEDGISEESGLDDKAKDYTDGLDLSAVENGTLEDKIRFINMHYANYLHAEFGEVPYLQMPGEPPVDNTDRGFNPEKVARYVNTAKSHGVQKNYDYIRHMLMRLGDDYDDSWISGRNYVSDQIRNDLIRYDKDHEIASFTYEQLVSGNGTDAMKNMPVSLSMMKHAAETLAASGCDPASVSIAIDTNGILHYTGRQTKGKYGASASDFTQDRNTELIDGYMGQIFEPDQYGVIDPKYVVDKDSVFVPGYRAYLVDNDPDDPKELAERLRLSGWEEQMYLAITNEIHNACLYVPAEYNFLPHTASLNRVYKHSYDTPFTREYYNEHLPQPGQEPTPEQVTFLNTIKTLRGRCRFPNSYDKGATTEAQSMLEHPQREESRNYDFYYSDLCGNENLRVLGEFFDGIFDPDMTGTARTQGIVRYLAEGATVDPSTGKVNPGKYVDGEPPKCALMNDPLFRYKDFDSWDRREMAASQTLTAWHTPRHVGTAMMTIDGWGFDDGFVVSSRFAERYPVKDPDGNMRPLMEQDKLSDFHGNKGVIGLVADPDLLSDTIADDLTNIYRENGLNIESQDLTSIFISYDIAYPEGSPYYPGTKYHVQFDMDFDEKSSETHAMQAARRVQQELGVEGCDDVIRLFAENEHLDVVMAPYSGMSRFNGGSVKTLMDEPDTIVVNGKAIEGGMGYTDFIVVDMLADVKSHFYDDDAIREGKGRKASAQLAWALQSKGAYSIMDEFYGDNGRAFDDLREYAIAIGLDFTEDMRPVVGYHPQESRNERRKLLKLPDPQDVGYNYVKNVKSGMAYFLSDSYNESVTDEILSALNDSGGFMELPFQLKFNTPEVASGVMGVNQIPDDVFKLLETGQMYTGADGKQHPTYGLPVLSASLRSGQDFQDGTSRPHDYTMAYVEIYKQAAFYTGCSAELKRLTDAMADAPETVPKGTRGVKSKADLEKQIAALSKAMSACQDEAQSRFNEITRDIVSNRFDTKYNVIREEVMSKKLSQSATAVWSADTRLKLDEVSMSMDNAEKMGLVEYDDKGKRKLVKDASILMWRDPVLRDGGCRYMKVVIDNRNLKGFCINPLVDVSFDGDFDGDSAGARALQTKEAQAQAYTKFAFETNFLNKGLKEKIKNPVTGQEMDGHPLFIQKGLDRATNEYLHPELKQKIDMLCWNINVLEANVEKWERGEISDDAITCMAKVRNRDAKKGEPAYVTKELTGKAAVNALRKQYKREMDDWAHDVLSGIGTEHFIVKDLKTAAMSMQHIVDSKAKGSQSKMRDFADNLGMDYELGSDGRVDLDTVHPITDKKGNVCPRSVADGTKRQVDKAIQETSAYKADNTQLGGTSAQRAVAAFRDINIKAALELTYPVTQAILQSKHDPKDAKIKDEIVRFWGMDCWNGYKLSGDWSPDMSPEDIQKQPHSRMKRRVLDADGNPIPVQVQITNVETGETEWANKMDKNGNIVYETEYVKCTREEWIAQMNGMFKALKVDINPDYIDALADVMYTNEKMPAVSAETGYVVKCRKDRQNVPVMSGNTGTVMGVDDYIKQHGALLDRMGYFGKAGAFIFEALKTIPEYVDAMEAIGNSYIMDQSKDASASAVMGDIMSYMIGIKSAEDSVTDARVMTAKAKTPDEKKEADAVRKQALSNMRDMRNKMTNSASFMPRNLGHEVYCDNVREQTGASVNVLRTVKNGEIVELSKAPVPVGRPDSRLRQADYEAGATYMGESQESYERRVLKYDASRAAARGNAKTVRDGIPIDSQESVNPFMNAVSM